jgi:hypothetical protein
LLRDHRLVPLLDKIPVIFYRRIALRRVCEHIDLRNVMRIAKLFHDTQVMVTGLFHDASNFLPLVDPLQLIQEVAVDPPINREVMELVVLKAVLH